MACKNSSPLSDAPPVRKPRTDGVQARERILLAALRLFVARGVASTPVRDIAHDAGVNIAAIAYYFGDKAGLYRAALYEPVSEPDGDAGRAPPFDAPGLPLRDALERYARHCLQPLALGEASLLSVRLRFREAVEPTGMLDQERADRAAMHRRLVAVLAVHAGLDAAGAADAELEALAFSIFALVAYPYFGRDRICAACPALLDAPDALEAWVARVADYALSMAAADARRRTAAPLQATRTKARHE